jgi:hypothetical protein
LVLEEGGGRRRQPLFPYRNNSDPFRSVGNEAVNKEIEDGKHICKISWPPLHFYKKIVRQSDLEFKIIYPSIVHYALSAIKIVNPQAVVGTIKYNFTNSLHYHG